MVKKFIISLLLSTVSLTGFSQTLTHSPYSRFGLGEMQFQGFADQRGIGQMGYAQRNSLSLSLLNPASYSALRMTNFRFGVKSGLGTMTQGDQSIQTNNASLNYLVLGFQVNKQKDWGVVFGMLPYSSINYDIQYDQNSDTAIGNVNNSLIGSGGLTRIFLGTGKEIGDNFSLGIQGSFLFGQKRLDRIVDFDDASGFLDYKESATDFIQGVSVEAGAQAFFPGKFIRTRKIKATDSTAARVDRDTTFIKHNFGLTYKASTNLDVKRELFGRTVFLQGTQETIRDTVSFEDGIGGKYTLPAEIGFGYMLKESNEKWRIGFDYTFRLWSQYISSLDLTNYEDEHQLSVGFGYRPSVKFYDEKTSFIAKTEYRAGAFYRTGYLKLNNTMIPEYGISLGFGIPLRMRTVTEEFKFQTVFSSLNFSIEFVRRGTTNNNLIQEDYVNFGIGVSLNDKWFNKRKIQ